MKKNAIFVVFACFGLSLFYACQGDPEYGNEDQCFIALSFEVLKTPCPEAVATFDLFFIDQDGNEFEFPFELPADAQETQFINLPSGNVYLGWVIGDGGLSFSCAGPFYFQINVMNPETGELCSDIVTFVDGRPDIVDLGHPFIVFALPQTCDGCPNNIIEPIDACIEEDCGGYYDGNYGGFGYYTYPEEELYICPNKCVRIHGDPFGIPNRYTLRGNGLTIDSRWVGDGLTYTQGPWAGTTIPYTYEFLLESQPDVEYTLQVETVNPQGMSDTWSCSLSCNTCD